MTNIPNTSQEPPVFYKAINQDQKDMVVLYLEYWFRKSKFRSRVAQEFLNHVKITVKIPNPNWDPTVSYKAPNKDLNVKPKVWSGIHQNSRTIKRHYQYEIRTKRIKMTLSPNSWYQTGNFIYQINVNKTRGLKLPPR